MKIVSWNVAGLRALLKKPNFEEYIFNSVEHIDILCFQETKAEEKQVKLSDKIKEKYVYRFWNSSKGTTQRKGLSGVTVWSVEPPINKIDDPLWDEEGRVIALEYEKFVLVNVYVPNSQKLECERYYFREKWYSNFINYIGQLKLQFSDKHIIICGDLNVAHLDNDISNPKKKKNCVAGFFDNERRDISYLLEICDLKDVFRLLNPTTNKSTYWSNFLKANRSLSNGWGIDYFICSSSFIETIKNIECNILLNIKGSDHCPLELIFDNY
jgi:exodeoxyribonuclease III